jgi:4-hydroxythreonine-4-phosphate dehydrogenase
MAGVDFPGHTEMLASLTNTRKYAMMLVGGPLKVMLATIHIALKDVPSRIRKKDVLEKIILAARAAGMFRIRRPHIAVCGLNPHAGEGGLFGREEIREIIPAIKKAQAMHIAATGPHPADSLFHKAARGEVDIVLAMYHDQGLAPFKAVAFESGVNITVGLPIIRTSPDHGTAYDIAWKGIASPASMTAAIEAAATLRRVF